MASIKIDNFPLNGEDSPVYYSENIKTVKIGGKYALAGGNYSVPVISNVSELTDLTDVVGITDSNNYSYLLCNNDKLFWYKDSTHYKSLGDMGSASFYSDILSTNIIATDGSVITNPILFTQQQKIGLIYEGTRTGLTGYGTSEWVLQNEGIDFTKMNLVVGDVVYFPGYGVRGVIKTGGIAATALTLTMDSSTGAGSDTMDYVLVAKQWHSLSDDSASYGRKIIPYAGLNLILNGKWLASVDSGMVFNANYLELDNGFIASCGASNGNNILIGSRDAQGRGMLSLWYSSETGQWANKIPLSDTINCIVPYKDGYVFLSGGNLRYTNGFTVQDLQTLPDYKIGYEPTIYPNSMTIVRDTVLVSTNYETGKDKGRRKGGIYIYDISKDAMSYSPFAVSTGLSSYGKTMCIYNSTRLGKILYGVTADLADTNDYSAINEFLLEGNTNSSSFILAPIKLEKNNNESALISKVEMNIVASPDYEVDSHGDSVQVELRLSDCSKHVWGHNKMSGAVAVDSVEMYHAAGYTRVEEGEEFYTLTRDGYIKRNIDTVTTVGNVSTVTFSPVFTTAPLSGDFVDVLPFKHYGDSPKAYSSDSDTAPITRLTFESIRLTADNVMLKVNLSGDDYPNFLITSITIFYE
jgi:hypothetical protein